MIAITGWKVENRNIGKLEIGKLETGEIGKVEIGKFENWELKIGNRKLENAEIF